MAILFISLKNPFDPTFPVGGAETSMKQIATGLANRGHRVYYVTHRASKGSRRMAESADVKLISYRGPTGWHKPRKRITLAILICQLSLIILSRKIRAFYCYYEVFGVAPASWVGKLWPRIFITVRIAGLSWRDVFNRSQWHRRIYKSTLERADQLNYIHPDLQRLTEVECETVGIDIRRARVLVGDIGIPLQAIKKTRPINGQRQDSFLAVAPSRFSPPKRQDLIVKALALLPKDLNITVHFVGTGKLEAGVKALAQKLLPVDRYHFLGFVTQKELWNEIQNADLVLLATDYEGLSKVTLETMALGTAVVTSNVTPFDSYIDHGKTGFLVENSAQGWALMLEYLLTNPAVLRTVVTPAQDFVSQHYSSTQNLDLYQANLFAPTPKGN